MAVPLPCREPSVPTTPHPDLIGGPTLLWLGLGSLATVVFIFAVPPTPFEALDYRSILLPYLTYYRDSLAAGEFPFWNPYASLGRPFAADPQAVAFWPPSLLYLGLGAFWGAIVLAWLHAWLAVWTSARLCLHLGAQRWPALLSGFVFLLSGKLTGHYQAGHLQFVFSYLYLPWLLHLGLRVQEERDPRALAGLGLLTGWQLLAGAPQVYWCCAIGLALLLTGRRLAGPGMHVLKGLWGDGWRVAVAYLWGLALAAVLLVPLIGLIGESNRAAARPDFIAVGSMAWLHWASLLTPWTAQGYTVDWELLLYPGMGVTLLGGAGLLRGRDPTVRGLWFVLAGAAVIAAGRYSPFFLTLVDWLPGYASFRVHGRIGAVLVYVLILSAVLFVSDPTSRPRQFSRLLPAAGLCLGLLTLLAWRTQADIVRPLGWLLLSLVAVAVWWMTPASRAGLAARTVLVAGLLADQVVTDLALKRIFITGRDYALETPLVEALHETGRLRPDEPPPRVFASPDQVRANAGMIYGFGTIAGSEALALQRVWSYVHWAVGREPPPTSDLYDFKAFADKGAFPVPWVAQSAALDLTAGRIEVLAVIPPRAWLVGQIRPVADWQEGAGRLAAGHDPGTVALLERPLPGIQSDLGPDNGRARWTGFTRNHLAVEASSPAPGVLVLAEAWHPGWHARVNGRPAAVFPVNGWMRGVVVPAGTNRVEMSYRPEYFVLGLTLSLSALAAGVWLIRSRRTRLV